MSVFDGFKPFQEKRIIKSVVRMNSTSEKLLSEYLAVRFTYRTNLQWLDEIIAGRLLVNGNRIFSDTDIADGDELVYEFAEHDEPECDLTYKILWADENFICVAKSGNLPIHPAGRYYKNTLWYILQKDFGACAPVNRLDRETSGIVIFARTPSAASDFSRISMQKKYYVIVHGDFPEYLDAKGFIFKDNESLIRKKRKFSFEIPDNIPYEDCHTVFRRIEQRNGLSLLEAELLTGRTHQIRATCCSLGFPVAGDKMYGVDETFFLRYIAGALTAEDYSRLIYHRQALHAYSLSFKNPSDGKTINFEAAFPLKI